jgi:hypothetical protein
MLRVADVEPGLEAVDLGQIIRLTIRVKEKWAVFGLERRLRPNELPLLR